VRITRVAVGVAAAASCVLASAPAGAWPVPSTYATGGGCTGSARTPIVWSVRNLETAFRRSPAHIEDVRLTPSFLTAAFSPASLPNTGTATATATTAVPPRFAGTVTLAYRMVWSGPDGADQRDGSVSVPVRACPQSPPPPPPTTTTTVPPPTTTTTTVPPPTTTTTTVPTPTTTTTVPTPVQFTVPPPPPDDDTPTTTTSSTPSTTVPDEATAVAGATMEAEAEAEPEAEGVAVAVKPIAVVAQPQFTG
jgi:hypothetical protein